MKAPVEQNATAVLFHQGFFSLDYKVLKVI